MSRPLSRDEAWTLFCEWTASESLRRHVLAVEGAKSPETRQRRIAKTVSDLQ